MSREQDQAEINRTVEEFIDALHKQVTLAPKIIPALIELRDLIAGKYPSAQFKITFGLDEPFGVQLRSIVDLEDIDEVFDVYTDRLLAMQTEQGLPIHVFPERPKI